MPPLDHNICETSQAANCHNGAVRGPLPPAPIGLPKELSRWPPTPLCDVLCLLTSLKRREDAWRPRVRHVCTAAPVQHARRSTWAARKQPPGENTTIRRLQEATPTTSGTYDTSAFQSCDTTPPYRSSTNRTWPDAPEAALFDAARRSMRRRRHKNGIFTSTL